MTDLTTEARADLTTALQEMSATKCKADHKTMGAKGKKTCPACGAKLGSHGVEEAATPEQIEELRESMLHTLETFDPAKHPRGRTGKFIGVLTKLSQDHHGTPDGHRFGLAAKNLHRYGKVNAFDTKPLRKLGPEASAQLLHMLTPLSLAHTERPKPKVTADEHEALRGMSVKEIRRAQNIVKAQLPMAYRQGNTRALEHLQTWDQAYGEEMLRRMGGKHGEANHLHPGSHKIAKAELPDHGPKGGQSSALKPLNLTVGPYKKVKVGQVGSREVHADVSKRRFTFDPVLFDRMNPNPSLKAGDTVHVTKLHGAPPPGTMGQYHVADEHGKLLGMVSGNSLKPLKTSDVGRANLRHGSLGLDTLGASPKPDRWNDRWNDLSMLRTGSRVQDAADAILDGGKSGPGITHVPGSGAASDTLAPEVLKVKPVNDLAEMIERDWGPKVNFAARPYLDAMRSMRSIDATFGLDSGRTVVAYFLSNASQWRGPVAKAVKKELKRRLDAKS